MFFGQGNSIVSQIYLKMFNVDCRLKISQMIIVRLVRQSEGGQPVKKVFPRQTALDVVSNETVRQTNQLSMMTGSKGPYPLGCYVLKRLRSWRWTALSPSNYKTCLIWIAYRSVAQRLTVSVAWLPSGSQSVARSQGLAHWDRR